MGACAETPQQERKSVRAKTIDEATTTELLEAVASKVRLQNEDQVRNSVTAEEKDKLLFPNASDSDAKHLNKLKFQINLEGQEQDMITVETMAKDQEGEPLYKKTWSPRKTEQARYSHAVQEKETPTKVKLGNNEFQMKKDFGVGGSKAEEFRMQSSFLWHHKDSIDQLLEIKTDFLEETNTDLAELKSAFTRFKQGFLNGVQIQDDVLKVLSYYNLAHRLRIENKQDWPRPDLVKLESNFKPALLPPPTPCEYVEDEYAWSRFDKEPQKHKDWLGHGYFWRQQPAGHNELLDNMAGSAMQDYDMLEDKFSQLKKSSVLVADYTLLKTDFPELQGSSDSEINDWLLKNAAYVSEGMVSRMKPGGDHHELLGIDKLKEGWQSLVDVSKQRSGIRIRSGGRAATFITDDGKYSFGEAQVDPLQGASKQGFLHGRSHMKAGMLDVKGIGVHIKSKFTQSTKNTGLLNYADALREFGLQRLVQRLADLEEQTWQTTKFYAILDTGMTYSGINPATGWKDEKCVLCVRQRQSRAFLNYEGFNFSGILLMTGEDVEDENRSIMKGFARNVRRVLTKYGISSEFEPTQVFQTAEGRDPCSEESLNNCNGMWNLQADATLSHLMDFSDYYVLPDSHLNNFWKMSEKALCTAFNLENFNTFNRVMESEQMRKRIFGHADLQLATQESKKMLEELSQNEKIVEAVNEKNRPEVQIEDEQTGLHLIKRGKPANCQCWFMELDDSPFSTWSLATGEGTTGKELLNKIDSNLPTKLHQ